MNSSIVAPFDETPFLEKVLNYVKNNTIPSKEGRQCVDGRYPLGGESSGMIARPGADMGYVMILLALNKEKSWGLTPEQIVDAVYSVITRNNGQFYKHTDHHATSTDGSTSNDYSERHVITGCSHIANACNPDLCMLYAVDFYDSRNALTHIRQRMIKGDKIKRENLDGEHNEQAVLIIKSKEKTVNHRNNDEMYFVYDKARDNEFMKKLTIFLNSQLQDYLDGVEISFEEFRQVSDKQTTATFHAIAKGKPMFEVDLEREIPTVTFKGLIGV